MTSYGARCCVRAIAALALLAALPAAAQDKAGQTAAAQKPPIIPTSVFVASSPYGDEPQLSPATQLSYDNDFFSRSERHSWHERIRGTARSFDMSSVSPLRQVSLLKRPVLLGHGKQDKNVPFSEFESKRAALNRNLVAGAEYVVLERSPFGFSDAKEKQAWLDALVAFLAKNDPPG